MTAFITARQALVETVQSLISVYIALSREELNELGGAMPAADGVSLGTELFSKPRSTSLEGNLLLSPATRLDTVKILSVLEKIKLQATQLASHMQSHADSASPRSSSKAAADFAGQLNVLQSLETISARLAPPTHSKFKSRNECSTQNEPQALGRSPLIDRESKP